MSVCGASQLKSALDTAVSQKTVGPELAGQGGQEGELSRGGWRRVSSVTGCSRVTGPVGQAGRGGRKEEETHICFHLLGRVLFFIPHICSC